MSGLKQKAKTLKVGVVPWQLWIKSPAYLRLSPEKKIASLLHIIKRKEEEIAKLKAIHNYGKCINKACLHTKHGKKPKLMPCENEYEGCFVSEESKRLRELEKDNANIHFLYEQVKTENDKLVDCCERLGQIKEAWNYFIKTIEKDYIFYDEHHSGYFISEIDWNLLKGEKKLEVLSK